MAKVLIIDDDQDIIDSLTLVLESNGYQVETKPDVVDVVQAVMDVHPDVIILDIMFPEDPQAGFVAARALAKSDKVRHIPVLLLSAVNQRSRLAFGFSDADISDDFMPVEAFLEKPVEPKVLLARLEALLKG